MEELEQFNNTSPQNSVVPTNEILPYNLNNIFVDKCSAHIISPAYSGRNSELTAILQYVYQHMIFDNLKYVYIAEQLEKILLEEMKHFELLGKTLLRLGVTPIYTAYPTIRDNYFTSRYVNYTTKPRQMLLSSIIGEQQAINTYKNMLNRLTNQEVKNVISYILMEEVKHLEVLNELIGVLNN